MTDIFTIVRDKLKNGLGNIYNSFSNMNSKFIIPLAFILLFSFVSLIPAMTMKPPCSDSDAYQNKQNCALLGTTDNSTMLSWTQDKLLFLYIMNIISSVFCFILAVILIYFISTNK